MNIDFFLSYLQKTDSNQSYLNQYEEVGLAALSNIPDVQKLLKKISGTVFENGLFNIHTVGSSYFFTGLVFEYFRKYKGNSYCFAFDWMGRQLAINKSKGKTLILMLDPATASAFELESDIEEFLNNGIEEFKNDALDVERFNIIRQSIAPELKFSQCIGFKQFLLLGGKDENQNIEISDMEVYWELNRQVYLKIKNLPPGTNVNLRLDPL